MNVKVIEGERTRIQAYEGVCIGRAGSGLNENFTVRKISYGEGVERVFPLYSPLIEFDQGRAPRQGAPRQALLPARPARQVRPHHREADPPRRSRSGSRLGVMRSNHPKAGKAGLSGLFLWCVLVAASVGSLSTASAAPLLLEVAHAEVAYDPRADQPLISFTLSETSRRHFAEFTAQNVGRKIEILVDGKVLVRTVVQEPIVAGSGQIAGLSSADEAKEVATRLTAGTGKLEVEVVPD